MLILVKRIRYCGEEHTPEIEDCYVNSLHIVQVKPKQDATLGDCVNIELTNGCSIKCLGTVQAITKF